MSSSYDSALRRRGRIWKGLFLLLAVLVCATVGFVLGDYLMSQRGGGETTSAVAPGAPAPRVAPEEMIARRLDAVAVDEASRQLHEGVRAATPLRARWRLGAASGVVNAPIPPVATPPDSDDLTSDPTADAGGQPARRTSSSASRSRDRDRDSTARGSRQRYAREPADWDGEPASPPPRSFFPVLELEVVDPYPRGDESSE